MYNCAGNAGRCEVCRRDGRGRHTPVRTIVPIIMNSVRSPPDYGLSDIKYIFTFNKNKHTGL